MKKSIFSTLLFLIFSINAFSVDFTYDGIEYTVLDENERTCKTKDGENQNSPGNVVEKEDFLLPEKVYCGETEYTVTEIGEYGFCKSKIKNLYFPRSIVRIGQYGFSNCSSLDYVRIPENIVKIDNYAFAYCYTINTVYLEPSENEFIPEENSFNTNKGNSESNYTRITNLFIGRNFTNKLNVHDVVNLEIGDLVTNIDNLSLKNMYNTDSALETITIGNSVQSIGPSAFISCSKLYQVILGKNCNSIGSKAFYGSNKLYSVILSIPTAPDIASDTFSNDTRKYGVFNVPVGSKANYLENAQFKDYNIRELELAQKPQTNFIPINISSIITLNKGEKTNCRYILSEEYTSWESTNSNVAETNVNEGSIVAKEYGQTYIIGKNSDGTNSVAIEVHVCPTISIEYNNGSSYTHHVIYNSTPSFYIAAPDDYEIISVEHDGADVTEAVLANEGYYTPASPITENSTIKVSLRDTRDPSDLNGDGVVDVSDLNFLIERIMNNN